MLFNSLEFLIFFPVVTIFYFLLPFQHRWKWLLAASCFFYMAFVPIYIVILFVTIVIDYFAGLLIEKAEGKRRKLFLSWSIVANVGVLAIFKYYNFFIENTNALLHSLNISTHSLPYLEILLPIGLSFHTFQAMSYTIEVYRGKQPAERHFGIYFLYVMFYPQLVAGPIERPQNILHQFREKKYPEAGNMYSGLRLMMWGMFKKVVVADNLAPYVDRVFSNAESYQGLAVFLAAIYFAIQVYCDFSGYSDIAIGSARIMGFDLMTNFRMPFMANSMSDFWRRWHISLSTWFKDYLYISLGGSRVSIPRRYFNLFLVFLLSGFWHGADWNYVVWGGLNGVFVVLGGLMMPWKKIFNRFTGLDRSPVATQIVDSLCVIPLFVIPLTIFRSPDLSAAVVIFKNMVLPTTSGIMATLADAQVYKVIGPCFVLFLVDYILERERHHRFMRLPVWVRFASYYLVIGSIFYLGNFNDAQFIYFQF